MREEFPGKGKVAVLRTTPETVLDDYGRLMELAGFEEALPKDKETILKINISWQTWYPACSTAPWQLEGVIRKLQEAGYPRLLGAHNDTVVVDARVGERNNKHLYVVEKYGVENVHLYEPQYEWVRYEPKRPFLVLDKVYPNGLYIPKILVGRNIIQLPTVKCVHPDTEIVRADGALVRAGELVEERLRSGGIPLLDEDGDVRVQARESLVGLDGRGTVVRQQTRWFWRTPLNGQKLWRIRTRTGREVVVSPVHPFLTPTGWRQAVELQVGDRVAIPRRIKVEGESQPLPRLDAVDLETIPCRNKHWIRVPERTSPDFWRWMGYLIAAGWVQSMRTTCRIWWTNGDPRIREEFFRLTESLFGLRLTCRPGSNDCYVDSVQLGELLEKLGLPVPLDAGSKRVPPLLFRCPDEEIAAFLSAYLDGNETVGEKDGLHATTKSERLSRELQYLLTRLGVVAFRREYWARATNADGPRRRHFQLSVYGDDLVTLAGWLDLHSGQKRRRLEALVARRRQGKQPSGEEIAWDHIVAVEEVEPDTEYLYDFTMDGAPNFIGNGLFLHNTHVFTTITGAMKNAFGGLLHRNRHWTHAVIHETLVDLLMISQDIHPGIFAVMDGTFAGDGPGPRAMRWHEKDVILASADWVAIDAISAHLQGFDPLSIPFIRIAHEMGLGVGDPREIEIVGEDPDWVMAQNWHFVQEDTFASRGQKMIYHGPLKPLEKPLLQSPLVPWSYFASNFYHNVYWYPFVGRKRVEAALQTKWGQLFKAYGDGQVVMPGMEPKTVLQAVGGLTVLGGLVTLGAILRYKGRAKRRSTS